MGPFTSAQPTSTVELMDRQSRFQLVAPAPVTITPMRTEGTCLGQVLASSHDEVKVQLDEDLEVGSTLRLETSVIWMLAEVVRCEPSREGFCADLMVLNWNSKSELKRLWEDGVEETAYQRAERRKHSRAAMIGTLRILWQDDDARERISRAQCANISTSGIRLHVTDRIPFRATIMFNSRELGIAGRGTVRSVLPRKAGFEIGVECASGTGWKTMFSKQNVRSLILRGRSDRA